jgi:hypothetical protein
MPTTRIEVPFCSAGFKSVPLVYFVLVKKRLFVLHSRAGADTLSRKEPDWAAIPQLVWRVMDESHARAPSWCMVDSNLASRM